MKKLTTFKTLLSSIALLLINLSCYAQFTTWKDILAVYNASAEARPNAINRIGFTYKNEIESSKGIFYQNYEKKMIHGQQGEWNEYMIVVKGRAVLFFTTENTFLFDKLKKEITQDYGFTEQPLNSKSNTGEIEYTRDSSLITLKSKISDDKITTKHTFKIVTYFETSNSVAALNKKEEKNIAPIIENQKQASTTPEMDKNQTTMRGSSDPLRGINISKAKSMKSSVGNYCALIIGIDKYSGYWNPLTNAVNDAKAFESVLKSKYKMNKIYTLFDEKATRTAIHAVLEGLVDSLKETDNLVIYYSGHGEKKTNLNKGYWIPVDAKTNAVSALISSNDIQNYMNALKTKHTLLISDACFSGDIFRGGTVNAPFEDSEKYYDQAYSKNSRQALTSGGDEPVMDGGKEGHSVFAYYLLKNLEANPNKYLDISQLFESLKVPVINNSDQTPRLDPVKNTGDEGGQFIFMKR